MSWQKIVSQVAPTIGQALGGPLGGLAINAICEALGLPAGSKDTDIERQLLSNPQEMAKIKLAELGFKEALLKAGVDLAKIEQQDKESARNRQIQLRDRMPDVLALVIIGGFYAVASSILSGKINVPPSEQMLVGAILGYASSKAQVVVDYYFGSSKGSEDKNKLLALQQK